MLTDVSCIIGVENQTPCSLPHVADRALYVTMRRHHCNFPHLTLSPGVVCADNGSVRQVCRSDVCDVSSINSQRLALRAFGLASYKLKGAVWTSQPDRRQATSLQNSADEHLKQLDVQHPDYNFFTSNSGHTRRWVITAGCNTNMYLFPFHYHGQNAAMRGHRKHSHDISDWWDLSNASPWCIWPACASEVALPVLAFWTTSLAAVSVFFISETKKSKMRKIVKM